MSKLVEIRANISYAKNKEGEFVKNTELVFLSLSPDYGFVGTEDNVTINRQKVVESRFVLTDGDFDVLIKSLEGIKNSTEEDYVQRP